LFTVFKGQGQPMVLHWLDQDDIQQVLHFLIPQRKGSMG
jgi:hypothetical protein